MPSSWPWPEENGTNLEDGGTYSDEVIAVFEVLRAWFLAMEDGTVVHRQPDLEYVRPNGKPPFTETQLDALVTYALDEWFTNAANVNYARGTRGITFDGAPEFCRLEIAQRLALAQELEIVMDKKESA